jgi:hypothetical protein
LPDESLTGATSSTVPLGDSCLSGAWTAPRERRSSESGVGRAQALEGVQDLTHRVSLNRLAVSLVLKVETIEGRVHSVSIHSRFQHGLDTAVESLRKSARRYVVVDPHGLFELF